MKESMNTNITENNEVGKETKFWSKKAEDKTQNMEGNLPYKFHIGEEKETKFWKNNAEEKTQNIGEDLPYKFHIGEGPTKKMLEEAKEMEIRSKLEEAFKPPYEFAVGEDNIRKMNERLDSQEAA